MLKLPLTLAQRGGWSTSPTAKYIAGPVAARQAKLLQRLVVGLNRGVGRLELEYAHRCPSTVTASRSLELSGGITEPVLTSGRNRTCCRRAFRGATQISRASPGRAALTPLWPLDPRSICEFAG